ncbi:MAG TPA: AAA family ATPase [Candidatus Baltobacteraceae bacterium]|nr:AAA family ATPase [Candidatus Baltobacteraceae bacterium]
MRAEREGLDRAIAGDVERVGAIRTALDTAVTAVWRDVFTQQQRAKSGDNFASAIRLEWFGGYQFAAIAGMLLIAVMSFLAFHGLAVAIMAVLYCGLAGIGYVAFQNQCVEQIKKARSSYLGADGSDVRFVAFTHIESGLNHPLVGLDGPLRNLQFDDRSWKIPGVRDDEALKETFVEVIDDRRSNVLLTRFPDKKPTLVHADLENPFIRSYGVFFQRALERHLPAVSAQADDFREVVARMGGRKRVAERVKLVEDELKDYDGTHAIMSTLPVSLVVREKLLRQVVLFRLGERSSQRGMMLFAHDAFDMKEAVQTLARASAASFVPFSFSSSKIGYVGQGASQVARIFETARRARSIIFIEDGDRLFNSTGSVGYESMRREVLAALTTHWDELDERSGVWIVAAAKDRDAVDPAILARFGSLIDLTPQVSTPASGDAAPLNPIAEPEAPAFGDAIAERVRILAAMFAHVDAMERQSIAVPRGVLVAGPSERANHAVIASIVEQAGLSLVAARMDDLDTAIHAARERERAIVSVDVPEDADPGSIAHLCVLIDDLIAQSTPIFILASTGNAAMIDPELRARFSETIDASGLDGAARRGRLLELFAGKPLEFDAAEHLDHFAGLTGGMNEERLREYVEEAIGRAAVRAIERGHPDQVRVSLEDFSAAEAAADAPQPQPGTAAAAT